jgi:hypothetical protein
MRSWIQEGRVTANSLVWRDGWPDWRSAATTFPSLMAAQAVGVGPAVGMAVGPHGGGTPLAAPVSGWQPAAVAQPGMAPVGMPLAPQGGIPLGHVMSALETPLGGYDAPLNEESPSRRKRKVKKGPDVTTYVALALVVMTVVLVVVLAVVLIKQTTATSEEAPPAAKTAPAHEAAEEEPPAEEAEAKPKAKKGKKGKPKAADAEAMPEEKM